MITILAIESSCDETAASVLKGNVEASAPQFSILSSVVKSQISLHKKMGGVVPEVAARAHVTNILPVAQKALKDAKLSLKEIDYLAVTSGPGLIGSLIVGVEFTKGLALATGKKIIPTNHMEGHLYSAWGGEFPISNFQFPIISLIVSGGHTMLVLLTDYYNYKVIGETVDDAAGEAFDKVAKLMGLPYPGGPEISSLAKKGKPTINFPRPMMNSKNYDFSFSGLKTAVRYYLQDHPQELKANIARSFEDAAIDVLVTKTMRAVKEFGAKTITLGGGVAANEKLRTTLEKEAKKLKLKFIVPPLNLCTDNAAMIAIAAYFKLKKGFKPVAYTKVKADSNWEIK
jgi:N6-L-threonylcarbamoyladenine synthase